MTFIIVVVILGIMVIMHELGHFTAAKLFGIGVPIFSIGMGRRLFGKMIKGTDYRVSVFPFGGYVKMKGMEIDEMDNRGVDDFLSKHPLKRMASIFAGPFANLVFAFLLMFFITMNWGITYLENSRLESVEGSAAGILQAGDSIISVNGRPVDTFNDVYKFLQPTGENVFLVNRNGADTEIKAAIEKPDSFLAYPLMVPVIGEIDSAKAAYRAGLRKGDRILSIDGVNTPTWQIMSMKVKENPLKEMSFKYLRGNDTLEAVLAPESRRSRTDSTAVEGFIGIGYVVNTFKPGFSQALSITVERIGYISSSIVGFLKMLFTGKVSLKMVGGPISIYSMTGESMKWGLDSLLTFVVFFSINLFIFNLIPFPPLDGGYIVLYLAEMVSKKRASKKFMTVYAQLGFIVLISLVFLVSVNDIMRFFIK